MYSINSSGNILFAFLVFDAQPFCSFMLKRLAWSDKGGNKQTGEDFVWWEIWRFQPIISSCNYTPVYQEVNSTRIMYVHHQRLIDMKRDSRFFPGRLGGTMKKRNRRRRPYYASTEVAFFWVKGSTELSETDLKRGCVHPLYKYI